MATSIRLQSEIFLDTSYVIALSTPKDNHHQRAAELSSVIASMPPRLVTTRGVLLEIGNAFSKIRYRSTGTGILTAIGSDHRIEIIDVTADLTEAAVRLYAQRRDKEWELTDCVSFVAMGNRGMKQALTADEHFEQAGFEALLRA